MKEHDCRILKIGEIYYAFYVDSNNFLHSLDGFALLFKFNDYWIHGKYYKNKRDWEIEVNRIKILEEC